MKNIIIIFSILFVSSCITVKEKEFIPEKIENVTANKVELKNIRTIRQALSDGVILNSDPYYSDFAVLILDLINSKNWNEISILTIKELYNDYVIDNNGELIDYCMFMLHTGDEGISTNYTLNQIDNAFYTDSYLIDDKIIYEGIYTYPTGETEFFKILLSESDEGLLITRE